MSNGGKKGSLKVGSLLCGACGDGTAALKKVSCVDASSSPSPLGSTLGFGDELEFDGLSAGLGCDTLLVDMESILRQNTISREL